MQGLDFVMIAAKRIDATKGPIVRQLLIYSFPLILSTLVQSLFNAVDVAVLGNMASSEAVASVGATTSIVSLLVNLFVGLASGVKILLARFLGEQSVEKVRKTADTAVLLAVFSGLIVSILGWTFSPALLRLLSCPEDCFDGAVLYLRVYLLAAPAILLYNYCSAILTSAGNTRSPMVYMMLGGALNLVLNILLCLILPNKVLAVALATAASQVLGAFLTLRRLSSGKDAIPVHLKKLRWSGTFFKKILFNGLPLGLSAILYPLGSLQVQSSLNSYGVSAIAGNSASITLENLTTAFHGNIGSASGVFIGQNLGAQQHRRVKLSFLHSLWLSSLVATIVGNTLFITGRFWVGLIVPGDTLAADFALIRMQYILAFQFVSACNNVIAHFLQHFGYSFLSSLNSIVCVLGFRVVWMTWIYPLNPTFHMLMACFLVSWLLMLATNTVMFTVVYLRYRKGKYRRL